MSLRSRVLHGGFYMVVRQGLGIAISSVGLILLTRAIGPGAYGIYAAAIGIYTYLLNLSQWGINVYLIRREEEPSPEDYHQAFSLLLVLGLAGTGLALLAIPFLKSWVRLEGFGPVAAVLFAALPVNLIIFVPLARLERALDYRKVALIELAGQLALYPVALPLAYLGLGPWAPVVGWWAMQVLTLGLVYWTSDYRPRLHWESTRVRAMVRYGLGFTASDSVWNLRYLVNPLVVGRYASAEAVGQVALAIRLVEQVSSTIMAVSWRLSIPVFARIQEDRPRTIKALADGVSLQLMTVGPLLAGFGLVAPWLIPLLFGPSWLGTVMVYPFIATGHLAGAAFNLHTSVLYVLRKIWEVAAFHLVYIILFAGSALLLVPRLGLRGYGWAELAALPSYGLLLVFVLHHIGRPVSAQAAIWFAAWVVPLFGWQLGPWAWISILVPIVWPATRRELTQFVALILRKARDH